MMPHVTCVCLTADRQAMTDRAVKSFLAQTYPNKSMLIWDNGESDYHEPPTDRGDGTVVYDHLGYVHSIKGNRGTIGAMRNWANAFACDGAAYGHETDIIAHWDSDDWSHPLRLAWQVQRLRGNEDRRTDHPLECVGYKTLLFWKREVYNMVTMPEGYEKPLTITPGEAWLFTHANPRYCVGTSLCYWRKAWESNPFRELYPPPGIGEDMLFLNGVKSEGQEGFFHDEPAMIAEIHGGNSTQQTIPGDSWNRVPEWDERLKELMKL